MSPQQGDMVGGLDDLCPVCHRISGDHTMREWAACLKTEAFRLPYQEIPEDMADIVQARLREQFRLDENLHVVDTITAKAIVLDGAAPGMTIRSPGVLHEFSIGQPHGAPLPVVRVLFVAPPEGMRNYGKLIRDTSNGAANAAALPPGGRGMGGGKRNR